MKTLCYTLGLLLLAVCCCHAMLEAVEYSTAPGNCCFTFSTWKIPKIRITGITKTHSSCMKKAFIVETMRGRQVCYSQSNLWVQKIYNQKNSTEGSGVQQ